MHHLNKSDDLKEMRVLTGVVYMTKSRGPRTEPWGTAQHSTEASAQAGEIVIALAEMWRLALAEVRRLEGNQGLDLDLRLENLVSTGVCLSKDTVVLHAVRREVGRACRLRRSIDRSLSLIDRLNTRQAIDFLIAY